MGRKEKKVGEGEWKERKEGGKGTKRRREGKGKKDGRERNEGWKGKKRKAGGKVMRAEVRQGS